METHTLKLTGTAPIRFVGTQISRVYTSDDRADPDYSGKVGVSEIITLYRKENGGFVVEVVSDTLWEGEGQQRDAVECATAFDIREALEGVRQDMVETLLDDAEIDYEDYYPAEKKEGEAALH